MNVVSWIGIILGAIIALGTIATFLRRSADKGTIESLERSNAAFEVELGLCKAKCANLETRVSALENENEVLRAAVSHIEEIRQLQSDVTQVLTLVKGMAT